MLHIVGGGRTAASRVDVADLFATRLANMNFSFDWVIFDPDPSPAWKKTQWHCGTAYVIGRSRWTGLVGAVHTKWIEFIGDLRTVWLVLGGSYDVVQVRDKFIVGALALVAAKLRRIPFTFWLSYAFPESRLLDVAEGRGKMMWTRCTGLFTGWLLYKIILPRADHIFVQSEQMRQDIAQKNIPLTRMTPVPMGVSEELLTLQAKKIEPDTIVYLGTLARVRKLDVLIDALTILKRHCPKARLFFVGEGDSPADRAFLEAKAEQCGVRDAVEFTGMLPRQEALAYAARGAVCVSPFYPTPVLRSTSPTKLVEYLALGRPVVVNSHPEQQEIIANSGAGICVEWSAQSFANAISMLLHDRSAAERKGAQGREYVRAHRLYADIARRVAERYRALLAGNGVRGRGAS